MIEAAHTDRVLLGIGGVLIALTACGLAAHIPGEIGPGSDTRLAIMVGFAAVATGAYFIAVALVLRQRQSRRAVWIILGVAAVLRLMVLAAPPFLSTDLYRYVWDGRVQIAGINPYRYIPADPALESLRDAAIFPHINRATTAPTIYPPMAQIVFRGIAELSQTTTAIKATMLICETIAIGVALRLLATAGLDRARILIYAWNPLAVWEYAGNGHVDALALGFIAIALLAFVRRWNVVTGAALGAAVLVKFLPLALFPALWRRWDWKMPAAMIAVAIVLYGFYLDAGWSVFGFLGGYAGEEQLGSGGGIYWLRALEIFGPLPAGAGVAWLALAAAGLAALGAWIALFRRGDDSAVSAAGMITVLGAALFAAVTPHYSWYYPWLALPACIAPSMSVIYLASAAFVLMLDPIHDQVLWPSLLFIPFLILAAFDLRRAAGAMHVLPAAAGRSL